MSASRWSSCFASFALQQTAARPQSAAIRFDETFEFATQGAPQPSEVLFVKAVTGSGMHVLGHAEVKLHNVVLQGSPVCAYGGEIGVWLRMGPQPVALNNSALVGVGGVPTTAPPTGTPH